MQQHLNDSLRLVLALPEQQVDLVIAAGREAVRTNPDIRKAVARIRRQAGMRGGGLARRLTPTTNLQRPLNRRRRMPRPPLPKKTGGAMRPARLACLRQSKAACFRQEGDNAMSRTDTPLWQLDATSLAMKIRDGTISAKEAVSAHVARMHAVNPQLNAVVEDLSGPALARADALDAARARGEAVGPLHGVPITIKINVDQAGHATNGEYGLVRLVRSTRRGRTRTAGMMQAGGAANPVAKRVRW